MVLDPFNDAIVVEPVLAIFVASVAWISLFLLHSGDNITVTIRFRANTAAIFVMKFLYSSHKCKKGPDIAAIGSKEWFVVRRNPSIIVVLVIIIILVACIGWQLRCSLSTFQIIKCPNWCQ